VASKPVPPKQVADKRETLKARIFKLVNDKVLEPLEQTPEAYAFYVLETTGFALEEKNYEKIIDKLNG
jgi:hypothetical protein